MKIENPVDLLREARRDWIKDTEWVGDQYGGVLQPTGEALRAFGARIDAALNALQTSNQRNAFLVAELRRLAKHYGGICQATLDEAADLLAEPGAPASTAVETTARPTGWVGHPSVADPAVTHDEEVGCEECDLQITGKRAPSPEICAGGPWRQEDDESRRWCNTCGKYEHEHRHSAQKTGGS